MLLLLRIRSGETSLFCGTTVINQVHDDLGFGLRVYMLMGSSFLLSDNFVTVLNLLLSSEVVFYGGFFSG
jgi:hypothetical protein